jgi:hypothetical protein
VLAIKIDLKHLDELIEIQKERKLAMDDLSIRLGIDISFSNEEVIKFAIEEYEKQIEKEVNREVEEWMKSLYS